MRNSIGPRSGNEGVRRDDGGGSSSGLEQPADRPHQRDALAQHVSSLSFSRAFREAQKFIPCRSFGVDYSRGWTGPGKNLLAAGGRHAPSVEPEWEGVGYLIGTFFVFARASSILGIRISRTPSPNFASALSVCTSAGRRKLRVKDP